MATTLWGWHRELMTAALDSSRTGITYAEHGNISTATLATTAPKMGAWALVSESEGEADSRSERGEPREITVEVGLTRKLTTAETFGAVTASEVDTLRRALETYAPTSRLWSNGTTNESGLFRGIDVPVISTSHIDSGTDRRIVVLMHAVIRFTREHA